jgi:hypothetical protein
MAGRFGVVVISFLAAVAGFQARAAGELRPSVERPDVFEIGDPVLISRATLEREMRLNSSLREHIDLYGWPDYAEVQEVQVEEPFASYEVRIYYLRRNRYLAYGRVVVAPSVQDFGVRKFEGPIRPETLDRLLTAMIMPAEEWQEEPLELAQGDLHEPPVAEVAAAVEAVDVEPGPLAAVDVEIVAEEAEVAPARASSERTIGEIVDRLEAAADRAAIAATLAEQASLAATSSADRATASLERLTREIEP